MGFDEERVRLAIEWALIDDLELDAGSAHNVAFHMTDWLEDLSAFAGFSASPESSSASEVTDLLMHFLAHVPNHLLAARGLLMDDAS